MQDNYKKFINYPIAILFTIFCVTVLLGTYFGASESAESGYAPESELTTTQNSTSTGN